MYLRGTDTRTKKYNLSQVFDIQRKLLNVITDNIIIWLL
jgi:hypothetical protein